MQEPDFDITMREDDDGLLVIAAAGDLDLSTVDELAAATRRGLPAHRAVVLDLTGLTFMDSSGIRLLIELAAAQDGTRVAFIAPADPVASVLEIAGVRDRLPWVRDAREALGA
jgi:anti-anti-sigma factor